MKSFPFGSPRAGRRGPNGAGTIASASFFLLSACAYAVNNGLDFSSIDGGLPSTAASGITGPGSGGRMVGSSSGSTESVGSSGEGGFGGMSSVGAGTGGMITGGTATGGSASGGSATGAGVGGTAGAGGNAGSASGGSAGQAGAGGGAGAGGRDGGSAGGAGGSTGGASGGGGSAGAGGAGGNAGAGGAGGAGGMTVRDAGPLVSFDDGVVGTATHQFNYAGTWGHCAPCTTATTPPLFNTSNSWADGTVTSQIVTFAFVGSQILFYGVQDPRNGIGAISIDGGAETLVDFYAAARAGNRLLFTSPFFSPGPHTFRLHATGTSNASSMGLTITVDRVDVH